MDIKKTGVCIKLNPKIYSLDIIHSAAYTFLDKAYLFIDGNPATELSIYMLAKGKFSSESERDKRQKELENEFLNELINYADYSNRARATKEIREILLKRIILTNDPLSVQKQSEKQDEELDKEVDELVDDLIKNSKKSSKSHSSYEEE